MENWTQRILLKSTLLGVLMANFLNFAYATDTDKPLIEPDVRPQIVDESLIDTENFELGVFAGVINIEDFESSPVYGARLAYHLSEYLFFEGNVAMAEGGDTSFETLGNVTLLTSSERDYRYYNFGVGFNLPGQMFFPGAFTFNTNFYLVSGVGATEFADDNRLTINFGGGYQVLVNDWLSVHLTVREHVYKIDLIGEEKNSFNTEISSGLSIFF